jgi:hypothetical protein
MGIKKLTVGKIAYNFHTYKSTSNNIGTLYFLYLESMKRVYLTKYLAETTLKLFDFSIDFEEAEHNQIKIIYSYDEGRVGKEHRLENIDSYEYCKRIIANELGVTIFLRLVDDGIMQWF